MSASRQIKVEILGDAKSLASAFGSAGKAAGGFGSALGGVAKIAGGFVVGQALTALPGLFDGISNKAVSLEQNARKAATVFGDSLGTVETWAKTSAAGMGLTNKEAVTLAASLGDLLVPLGFTREEAAKMSTDTLNLAGALAEWSGGTKSAAEVSDILTSAMLGETDGLKALGISLSADEIKKKAAENASKGLTFATEQQAEAYATQQLIMEKSTDAQKAYADSQDDAASKQARLTAKISEMKERLAAGLFPVLQIFIGMALSIANMLTGPVSKGFDVFRTFSDFIAGVFNRDLTAMGTSWQKLPGFIRPVASLVKDFIGIGRELVGLFQGKGLSEDFASQFGEMAGTLRTIGQSILERLAEWGEAFVGFIAPYIPPMLSKLMELGSKIVDWITSTALPWLITTLQQWGTAFVNWVTPLIPPLLTKLGEIVLSIGDWALNTALPAIAQRLGVWADAFGAWVSVAVPPMLEQLSLLLESLGTWIADIGLPLLFDKLGAWGQSLVDWVGPRIGPVLEALGAFLLAVGEWIITTAAPAIGEKLLEWGLQFVAWVKPQIGPMLSELGVLLTDLGSWLINTAVPEIAAKLAEWGAAFIAWVGPVLRDLPAELEEIAQTVITFISQDAAPRFSQELQSWSKVFLDWTTDVDNGLPAQLEEISVTIANFIVEKTPVFISTLAGWHRAFLEWILPVLKELPGQLALIDNTIAQFIVDVAAKLIPYLHAWAEKFWLWVLDVIAELPGALGAILRIISGWVDEHTGEVGSSAGRMGRAFVDGLIGGLGNVVSKVQGIIDGIMAQWDRIPAFLRPGSPSKWAREQSKSLVDGLVVEMVGGLPRIRSAIDDIVAEFARLGALGKPAPSSIDPPKPFPPNIDPPKPFPPNIDPPGSGPRPLPPGGPDLPDPRPLPGEPPDGILPPPVIGEPASGTVPERTVDHTDGKSFGVWKGGTAPAAAPTAAAPSTGGAGGGGGDQSRGMRALREGATFLGCSMELIGQDNGTGLFQFPDGAKHWLEASFCKGGKDGPSDAQLRAASNGGAPASAPQGSRLVAQTRTSVSGGGAAQGSGGGFSTITDEAIERLARALGRELRSALTGAV